MVDNVQQFLDAARKASVIDKSAYAELREFHRTISAEELNSRTPYSQRDNAVPNLDDDRTSYSSESPRFIRGFHDVLITLGIVSALGGLLYLLGSIAAIVAIVILSEIFVRRQRLALPAFTLTLATLFVVSLAMIPVLAESAKPPVIKIFLAQVVSMVVYYWRYRVPIALAGLIATFFGLVFVIVLYAFGFEEFTREYPRTAGAIGLVFAAGMFAVAMRYDFSDRMRETRRSDVAFWLHLVTAPALLFSAFLLVFGEDGFWWSGDPQIHEALAAIGMITVMAMLGIIIDRRAFVTAGMISLGVAFGIITQETSWQISSVVAFCFFAVGIVVLLLGSGWRSLRRFFLSGMPDNIKFIVPPVID